MLIDRVSHDATAIMLQLRATSSDACSEHDYWGIRYAKSKEVERTEDRSAI